MTANAIRDPETADRARGGLLRLVYLSVATRPLSAADLEAIERRSSRRNAAAGITGLVVAQEPFFYGIMEGPSARLLARMEVIITDPRHCRLRILLEESLASRRFHNWRLFRLPGLDRVSAGQPPSAAFILELAQRLT